MGFLDKVKEKASGARQSCQAYAQKLKDRVQHFGPLQMHPEHFPPKLGADRRQLGRAR